MPKNTLSQNTSMPGPIYNQQLCPYNQNYYNHCDKSCYLKCAMLGSVPLEDSHKDSFPGKHPSNTGYSPTGG